MMHAGLRRRIYRSRLETHYSEIRTDVDDLAPTLGNHNARRLLTCKEDALQRRGHGAVVLLLGNVESQGGAGPTCIVDKDIDAAERLGGLLHQRAQVGN